MGGFKTKEFDRAKIVPRQVTLEGPDMEGLADFFDGPPAWTLRSIDFDEYERCRLAAQGKVANLGRALAALVENPNPEALKEAQEAKKDWDQMLPSTQLSCEMLALASVNPKMDVRRAIKLSRWRPVEFGRLASTSWELFGKGQVTEKKSPASSENVTPPAPLSTSAEEAGSTSTALTSSPMAA